MFMYWSGVAFWFATGMFAAWVVVLLIRDGIQCARFVWRRISIGGWQDDVSRFVKTRVAVRLWLHYFASSTIRPDYLTFNNGERAYWPGYEPKS